MLDISIKHFNEFIEKDLKKPAAAYEFCHQQLKIVEKLDGTKLTLIRTDEDLTEDDPLRGWIISYKEGVIYPEEFSGLTSDIDVKSSAVGRLWYNEVINHLKRAMADASNRSFWQGADVRDLEIFIEFIQRKGTLARQYKKLGDLYLTAIGKSLYSKAGSRVTSVVGSQIEDPVLFENVLTHLNLNSYPILFEGDLSSLAAIEDGIRSEEIGKMFDMRRDEFESAFDNGDWKEVLRAANKMFKNFESHLGNTAEGVVITVLPRMRLNPDSGELELDPEQSVFAKKLLKTYSMGQSSKREPGETDEEYAKRMEAESDVREKASAVSGKGTEDEEKIFWDALTRFLRRLIRENKDRFVSESIEESIAAALKYFSNLFLSSKNLSFEDLKSEIENEAIFPDGTEGINIFGRRDETKLRETVMSSARDLIAKFADAGMFRPGAESNIVIGIVPMAAKPVHLGHWSIIEKASEECNIVYLVVSAKSRTSGESTITGEQMGNVWMKALKNYLPQNVVLSFSESPISSTTGVISKFVKDPSFTFNVYAGKPDAGRGEDVKLIAKAKEAASKDSAADRVDAKTIATMLIPDNVKETPSFKRVTELQEYQQMDDEKKERISGELMRILLKNGIKDVFFALFPPVSNSDKSEVWRILGGKESIAERVLRAHIRECLVRS